LNPATLAARFGDRVVMDSVAVFTPPTSRWPAETNG
jgi:hypothetical protein